MEEFMKIAPWMGTALTMFLALGWPVALGCSLRRSRRLNLGLLRSWMSGTERSSRGPNSDT